MTRRVREAAGVPDDAGVRQTVHDLLARARARLDRLTPPDTLVAMRHGALLIDLRTIDDRTRHGVVPQSIHVPRTVLERTCDPASGFQHPEIRSFDLHLVLLCNEGYSSSLAAATLHDLGFARATDVAGGFRAWVREGLPVVGRPAPQPPHVLDGRAPRQPGGLGPDDTPGLLSGG